MLSFVLRQTQVCITVAQAIRVSHSDFLRHSNNKVAELISLSR